MNADREFLSKLNNIFRENDEIYRHAAKKSGLSDCAFWILYTLRDEGNITTQSQICSAIYLPKQTVNSAMKKLENSGYIQLLNTNDRRSKQVSLTPKGVALAEKTVDRVIFRETDALSGMTPDEKEAFLRLFRKYTDLLNANLQKLAVNTSIN